MIARAAGPAARAVLAGRLLLAAPLVLVAAVAACDLGTGVVTPGSVEVIADPDVLAVGETTQLEVIVLDDAGRPLTLDVGFTSSAPNIATVDGSGLVTAVSPGSAQITAEAGGVTDAVVIVVTEVPASIEVSSPVDLLKVGQTAALDVTVRDAAGALIPNARVAYTSSDPSVATVDDDGVVTGVGGGPDGLALAEITGTAGTATDATAVVTFETDDYCATGLVVPLNSFVRTVLQDGDCDQIFNGEYVDIWFMEIEDATTVTLDMTSDDFDAYLVLEDEDINPVAENDDGGEGTNARIVEDLEPGGYWILTTSFDVGETGVYTLTVADDGAGEAAAVRVVRTLRVRAAPDLTGATRNPAGRK